MSSDPLSIGAEGVVVIWIGLLISLVIALVLTAILAGVLGRRRPRAAGGWRALLFFFILIWLATWAVAAWDPQIGPVAWGVSWVLLLIAGIVFGLLIAVATPSLRGRPISATEEPAQREPTYESVFGWFFWLLLFALLLVLAAGYWQWR